MAEGEEDLCYGQMAERGGEVERGVRETMGCGIRIMKEVRVCCEDSAHEEGVRRMDCAAEAEGRVNPREGKSA